MRYHAVISERGVPKDELETLVRGSIWDPEIRAAIWHICELEVAFRALNKLMMQDKV